MIMKRILFSLVLLASGILFASEYDSISGTDSSLNTDIKEEGVSISYLGSKSYNYIERTDLRRYDNGKYKGLVSREIRSSIIAGLPAASSTDYEGSFYVYEATKRASAEVFPGLDDSIPSRFAITLDGEIRMIEDNGYPSFRGFPTYTSKKIKPGDSWKGNAIRTVDPLNKGIFTKIPFLVEYTYLRDEIYNGEEVFLLSAKWATRYGRGYTDPSGDPELLEAQGSNSATIYVSKQTGMAIVIRDTVDELYTYADGNKIALKGTINLFTKYQPAINKEEVAAAIQSATGISDDQTAKISGGWNGTGYGPFGGKIPGGIVDISETFSGIVLSIPDLKFKSDTADLLNTEKDRLDKIAEILKSSGNSMLLIEGHTADTGNPKGELALSKERAKIIATELVKRGISSDRFVIKGRGADHPIADNSTKEGMAKNRRVEITILN